MLSVFRWERDCLWALRVERNPSLPIRAKAWRITLVKWRGNKESGRETIVAEEIPTLSHALRTLADVAEEHAPKGGW